MEQCKVSTNGGKSFPNNVLRVLSIDDDIVSLKNLKHLLSQCGYKVTVTQHASYGLKLLRENKDEYDTVITCINTPEIDEFKLLENSVLRAGLPLIVISVDCDVMNVIKETIHHAVQYLVKPVQLEELKVIWKFVGRKSFKESNDPINKLGEARTAQKFIDSQRIRKRKKHENESDADDVTDDDTASASSVEEITLKKSRISWNKELHSKFIDAINKLGLDRAVPKKILEIMNVPGLSRENVASHLQKHRRGLKKKGMRLEEHFNPNTSTNAYGGSLNNVTINNQCQPINSFKNFGVNEYKCMSGPFKCFPSYRSHNGHAVLLPTGRAHPFSQQNDFSRQYPIITQSNQLKTRRQCMIGLQTSQSVIENPDPMTNYLGISAPTQASSDDLSHLSFLSWSNQHNYYTQTSQVHFPHDRNSAPHSAHSLGYAEDLDESLLAELSVMLPSEQELQELSACTGLDVEIGTLVNNDLSDTQNNANEDIQQSSLWDLPFFSAEISSSENASWNDVEYEEVLNHDFSRSESHGVCNGTPRDRIHSSHLFGKIL